MPAHQQDHLTTAHQSTDTIPLVDQQLNQHTLEKPFAQYFNDLKTSTREISGSSFTKDLGKDFLFFNFAIAATITYDFVGEEAAKKLASEADFFNHDLMKKYLTLSTVAGNFAMSFFAISASLNALFSTSEAEQAIQGDSKKKRFGLNGATLFVSICVSITNCLVAIYGDDQKPDALKIGLNIASNLTGILIYYIGIYLLTSDIIANAKPNACKSDEEIKLDIIRSQLSASLKKFTEDKDRVTNFTNKILDQSHNPDNDNLLDEILLNVSTDNNDDDENKGEEMLDTQNGVNIPTTSDNRMSAQTQAVTTPLSTKIFSVIMFGVMSATASGYGGASYDEVVELLQKWGFSEETSRLFGGICASFTFLALLGLSTKAIKSAPPTISSFIDRLKARDPKAMLAAATVVFYPGSGTSSVLTNGEFWTKHVSETAGKITQYNGMAGAGFNNTVFGLMAMYDLFSKFSYHFCMNPATKKETHVKEKITNLAEVISRMTDDSLKKRIESGEISEKALEAAGLNKETYSAFLPEEMPLNANNPAAFSNNMSQIVPNGAGSLYGTTDSLEANGRNFAVV